MAAVSYDWTLAGSVNAFDRDFNSCMCADAQPERVTRNGFSLLICAGCKRPTVGQRSSSGFGKPRRDA